ncbi:hypothetical protein B9Z55_003688 [Caenorhabditis nigoni]|uniref:F-box domain-containing protein n=1 Tax=Caenorhabditis nigoni TaxID=1611254 RepID=A0A2G5VRX8_9PELO|nr:hypothetical protein B9Z55_003688 [Caenorhabditis nigoni]
MPIALLKFPTDLLRDVFKLCNPIELYCLSKCSKRTQRSIKLSGTRNWKLFSGSNRAAMHVDDWMYSFYKAEKPEAHFKQVDSDKYVRIQCPEGDVDLFFILLDTFGIRLVGMLSIDFCNFESFSKIANILIERNMEVERFHIGCSTGTFPNLRWLQIYGKKIDNQSPILDMIPPIQIVGNPRVEVTFGYRKDIVDGVPVSKDDGTVGWLKVELGGRWPELKFLVVNPDDTVITPR